MDRGNRRNLEGFAEDLGKLLGTAQAKAQNWIGQRQAITKELEQIRDLASRLLHELSGAAGRGRRRPGSVADAAGKVVAGMARGKRNLSAKARKAISDAQKRRWAAVRAAKKAIAAAKK